MQSTSQKFIHLHTHSHYSLLTALPKIPDLIEAAKKNNMEALALTDNGNMYGTIEFYKKCKKENIKPIIGIDAYVALRGREDKEAGLDNKRSRLVLLAKNNTGYKNLIKLVTKSNLEGFYYKPRIDHELIEKYHDGLIAIIPSFSGETTNALKINDVEKATELVNWYKKVFANKNSDDVYLEITHHPEIDGHEDLQKKIIEFAKETKTQLVAAHDVYYLKPEDKKAREILLKIQTNTGFGGRDSFNGRDEDFSFISQKMALNLFKNTPEALQNTIKIVEKCNLELDLGKWVFPDLKLDSDKTYDEELRYVVYKSLKERKIKKTKEVEDRIEYELKIISDKGYSPYFLVVADLIKYARDNNILTTTRGSATGSMVSYLARITNVDPIEYKLPFERFLNPERPSPPDIDLDIADNCRDKVIQYAKDKYGEDSVAQIGTFGTMLARGVVRDIARALGHPYNTGDKIAKLIPLGSQGFPMTIEKAFGMTPELKEMYKKEKDVREIIDLSKKIEGNVRHISVHAAGVVISPTKVIDYVPVQFDPKGGKSITQYDMHAVEDAGLLKFDFLGIKNLSIITDSVKRVKKIQNIDIDIENIPLDDKKTFELLSNGETEGVFQLNGSGMTHFLKELKPTTIHDINAMVALYRPGPMDVIPEYIKRKHNPSLISYPDPRMEKYLKESYGLIVYQDDLLISTIELAGYSWLEADKFRKAVGKKIPAEMAAQKDKLISGVIENGQTKEFAEKLWNLFEPFQSYGFNKAHAASYGKVAYQTAYMKANYPLEYMSAVLTADSGNVDRISEIINECTRMKIPVLPPNINESFGGFSVVKGGDDDGSIRFGLYSIKNFGEGIADVIINERKKNGKYSSLSNFLERVKDKNLNKKSLESLIKCGALDVFEDRGKMIANTEEMLTYHKEFSQIPDNQDSLFVNTLKSSASGFVLKNDANITQEEKLSWEKELLGLYVSGHPLDKFKEILKGRATIKKIHEELHEGMMCVASGIVEEIRPVITKKGDRMAFLKIADLTGSIDVVLFPKIFADYGELIQPESCIAIKGRKSERNGETSLIAEAIRKLKIEKK